jgi:hypothetical protein
MITVFSKVKNPVSSMITVFCKVKNPIPIPKEQDVTTLGITAVLNSALHLVFHTEHISGAGCISGQMVGKAIS